MIKLIRLITGEDIVSEVSQAPQGAVLILKKPHRLVFSKEGLASMPLCPFSKTSDYEIALDKVLFQCEPEDEIRDSYANAVGAILVPSSGIMTP